MSSTTENDAAVLKKQIAEGLADLDGSRVTEWDLESFLDEARKIKTNASSS